MGKTEHELQQASAHVKYELEMAAATTLFLSKAPGETSLITWNAYVESYVLHVRNLIDFFYLRKQEDKDDILAEDFVADKKKWKDARPSLKTQTLKEAKTRVDKLAAHLTYNRLVLDKNWKFAEIRADLDKVVSCFLDNLPSDRMAWFQGAESPGPTGSMVAPSPAGTAGATGTVGSINTGGGTVSS